MLGTSRFALAPLLLLAGGFAAVKSLHRRLATEGTEAPYPVRTVRWTGGAAGPPEKK